MHSYLNILHSNSADVHPMFGTVKTNFGIMVHSSDPIGIRHIANGLGDFHSNSANDSQLVNDNF